EKIGGVGKISQKRVIASEKPTQSGCSEAISSNQKQSLREISTDEISAIRSNLRDLCRIFDSA
ncbi:MAG: hypothetical protein ABIE92_07110, partial [bacterium]